MPNHQQMIDDLVQLSAQLVGHIPGGYLDWLHTQSDEQLVIYHRRAFK